MRLDRHEIREPRIPHVTACGSKLRSVGTVAGVGSESDEREDLVILAPCEDHLRGNAVGVHVAKSRGDVSLARTRLSPGVRLLDQSRCSVVEQTVDEIPRVVILIAGSN